MRLGLAGKGISSGMNCALSAFGFRVIEDLAMIEKPLAAQQRDHAQPCSLVFEVVGEVGLRPLFECGCHLS